MSKNEYKIIDFIDLMVRWRKSIVVTVLVVGILSVALSLILPKWYTANTTVLPPVEDGGGLGISSFLSNIAFTGGGLGLGMMSEETSIFMAILNSRTLMEVVIDQFDLMDRYKSRNQEEAVRTLRDRVSTKVNEEGTITLSVRAKTRYFGSKGESEEARKVAKEMANYFIQTLDSVNKELKVERARNTRLFIETRYIQNRADLERAEESFKLFQETHGVVALPEQTTATISAAAEMKAQIVRKEVEVGLLRKYVGVSHADYVRSKDELDALQIQFNRFQYGKGGLLPGSDQRDESKDVFLPLENVPGLGLEYARRLREVTMQQKIQTFLLPEYEQAKINEAKDTPTVQILDRATLPIMKSRPKRAFLVILSVFASFCVLVFFIVLHERIQELKNTDKERYLMLINAWGTVKRDLQFWKRNNR